MPYHSSFTAPNFIYPDGSGFMFDLPPQAVLWSYDNWLEGGIYDIPNLPRFNTTGAWMGWTQWIEKWQKDYRFLNVSDYNATANIFPEVHDPYMFVENVFTGLSKSSSLPDATSKTTGIVSPPMVCPVESQSDGSFKFLNDQPVTPIARDEQPVYTLESKWKSLATNREFWSSQLEAMRWTEALDAGGVNKKFTRLNIQRRVVYAMAPSHNAGVKTYREPVWSQALRWGHSQNIPSRTVTMTGPQSYFRPEGFFTGKIVPHVEIRSGTPIYDNLSSAPTGQQAAFHSQGILLGAWANTATLSLATVTPTGTDGPADSVFTYPTTGLNGSRVPIPQLTGQDKTRYTWNEINFTEGDLVHRGCAFWDGHGGEIKCRYYWDNPSLFTGSGAQPAPVTHKRLCAMRADGTNNEAQDAYVAAGGTCQYYTPQGPRALAAYEGVARTQEQLNHLKRMTQNPLPSTSGLPGLGGFIADRLIQPLDTSYKGAVQDVNAGLQRTRVEITYAPEVIAPSTKKTGYNTEDGLPANPKEPEDGMIVKPGTGQFPIDEKAQEPFKGVDTTFFGFVNQVNYRVMQNVQHCYKPEHCDSIITTRSGGLGFIRGRFSNVDFRAHALRVPGYPASDGTDTYCHYGNGMCPYNQLDRRAVEYDGNYQILVDEILRPFRRRGIAGFGNHGIAQGFLLNGQLSFPTQDDVTNNPGGYTGGMWVAVGPNGDHPPICGHWQPVVNTAGSEAYRIYFFYTAPSWQEDHRQSTVAAHIVQFDDDGQPCYIKDIPTQFNTKMQAVYGTLVSIPWLVTLDDDYKSPTGNLMLATNNRPFWGGRSPQYKDHTKRGREIRSTWGGYRTVSAAVAGNQFGGVRWGQAPMSEMGTRGYWTDADGDFIITGVSGLGDPISGDAIGGFNNYVPVLVRIANKPPRVNGALPINGVPGLSINDPANPGTSQSGDYAAVGATYSNDTKALHDWFREIVGTVTDPVTGNPKPITRWYQMLPVLGTDDNGNETKPPTAPPGGDPTMLPLERYVHRCNVCGVEATEEEVRAIKNLAQYAIQDSDTPPTGASMRCPRHDGGFLIEIAGMDQIFPSTARGYVDVWAPPGTTVRHDGFFWKSPQLVTRLTESQISQKLGRYNPAGGGYSFSNLDPNVERMGGTPHSTSTTWKPGIDRQMILPWATIGENLATVRERVKPWMGLDIFASKGAKDVATVSRVGQNDIRVEPVNESSFSLVLNDVIKYTRELPDGSRRFIGLLINVSVPQTGGVANEPVVASDTARPNIATYPSTEQGIALYQQDLREWLLNAVKDTLYGWSSNISNPKNALASQLEAKGINPDLGKPYNPGAAPGSTTPGSGAGPIDIDERILGPYAEREGSGLQIIGRRQMQRLRNRIIPALAYDITNDGLAYTAGGDFSTVRQLSNSQRFKQASREVSEERWGTIPPQVMAATQTGRDTYVEWDDPTLVAGPARGYYPVGSTWWRIYQRVGNIRRARGTNPLHLDADPAAVGATAYQYYLDRGMSEYTGEVVSTVTFFLHGRLPLDKEVVAAYLAFTTDDGPSAAALGCVGSYDGFEGTRNRDGTLREDTAVYRGNSQCYWQHFHPWTTSHENDIGSYRSDSVSSIWGNPGYGGFDSREHWITGPKQDAGTPWTASEAPTVAAPYLLKNEHLWWFWREEDRTKTYDPNLGMLGMRFFDQSFGFEFDQGILADWTWASDLVQLRTEHQVWKELTYAEFNETIKLFSANVMASVNTRESVLTFDYFSQNFRNGIYQRQMQGVPGWINYANYDSSGRFARRIDQENIYADTDWANGPQVIVQADPPGGGGGAAQAGNVERLLNITRTIKRQYNQRVPRFFKAKTGVAYADLFGLVRSKTDTNITAPDAYGKTSNGLALRFHADAPGGGEYAPAYWFNYRYLKQASGYLYGMWMNDPWHMPALSNDQATELGEDPADTTEAVALGRVFDCSEWDKQGLEEDDEEYRKYHPWSLCQSNTPVFNGTSGTEVKPQPAEDAAKYWRVALQEPSVHWFTIDLRQYPHEQWRRPFRYRGPTIDSTNATCPNVNGCRVAQQGMAVGELYTQSIHSVVGGTVTPSTSSSRCAICGTPLVGVLEIDGDGIETVSYDPINDPNPILNSLEISIATQDGWKPDLKHGFVVETYNSSSAQWRVLFVVTMTESGQFRYRQWSGSMWQYVETTSLPEVFKGWEGDHLGNPRNAPAGIHFVAKAAQKVRFKVTMPAFSTNSESGDCTADIDGLYQVVVDGLDDARQNYVGRNITLLDDQGTDLKTLAIVDTDTSEDGVVLKLNGPPGSDAAGYRIEWNDYVARCTKFRAYGYPFATGEVVITPPAIAQDVIFSLGVTEFAIPSVPTQITKIEVSAGDDPGVAMTEVENPNVSTFQWEVETTNYGGRTYKRLVGGQWYYDPARNSIRVPSTYMEDGKAKNIWEINKELYEASPPFLIDTRPSKITIEYFTGLGVAVDVDVEAYGVGPSYQLDKESVCFVAGNTPDDEQLPSYVETSSLPSMGESIKLPTKNNQRETLTWHCYNQNIIVWKQNLGFYSGDELGQGAWDDNSIMNLWSGNHGTILSDIGQDGFIRGKAKGKVTLYGAPGVIVSGKLTVYAKAITRRSFQSNDGQVVSYERTGGFKEGAFVFRLNVNEVVAQGRKSISCGVPRVVVYLRERDLNKEILGNGYEAGDPYSP